MSLVVSCFWLDVDRPLVGPIWCPGDEVCAQMYGRRRRCAAVGAVDDGPNAGFRWRRGCTAVGAIGDGRKYGLASHIFVGGSGNYLVM